jgi:hypothetical protein
MLRKAKDTRGRTWLLAAFEAWQNELLLGTAGIQRKMAICGQGINTSKESGEPKALLVGKSISKGQR